MVVMNVISRVTTACTSIIAINNVTATSIL